MMMQNCPLLLECMPIIARCFHGCCNNEWGGGGGPNGLIERQNGMTGRKNVMCCASRQKVEDDMCSFIIAAKWRAKSGILLGEKNAK